ncbi:MAG: hypothetical protein NVS2B15_15580 [Pseudarthrobacter sp.]
MDNTAAADIMETIAASAWQMSGVLRGAGKDPVADRPAGPNDALPITGSPLMGGGLAREQAETCLTVLSGIAGMEVMFAAVKVHTAGGFDEAARLIAGPISSPQEQTAQEMGTVAEVACALTVSERTGSGLLAEAHRLLSALPLTLAALAAGTISWQHARIMVDETINLDRAGAAALEAHFLDPAAPNPAWGPTGELTPGRFRAKARTWRERHHPESIEQRHTRSAADRRLEYTPDRDGMAWLSAYLPAEQAAGIWDRATTAARALQGPAETRTLTQLRADTAAAWLLGGQADLIPSPKAQVLVTVPVFSLLGATEEPAMLDGYGPIPASMARDLVANGADSFHRVLVDPRDGAPLEIGRSSYRVPKAMRQWLRLRDGKCPFPGCSNQSPDNEADHVLAWANGGTTGITNLGQPCRRHHKLRHTTVWTPTGATQDKPPGWISPSGRHYTSEHPDWEPPIWPDQLEDPGFDAVLHDDQGFSDPIRGFPLPEDDLPDYVLFPDDSLPGRPSAGLVIYGFVGF